MKNYFSFLVLLGVVSLLYCMEGGDKDSYLKTMQEKGKAHVAANLILKRRLDNARIESLRREQRFLNKYKALKKELDALSHACDREITEQRKFEEEAAAYRTQAQELSEAINLFCKEIKTDLGLQEFETQVCIPSTHQSAEVKSLALLAACLSLYKEEHLEQVRKRAEAIEAKVNLQDELNDLKEEFKQNRR